MTAPKVTVLPYIPPERKSVDGANERARQNHEAHQRDLDALMFKPSKPPHDEAIDAIKETQFQLVTQSMPSEQIYRNLIFPIDRGRIKA